MTSTQIHDAGGAKKATTRIEAWKRIRTLVEVIQRGARQLDILHSGGHAEPVAEQEAMILRTVLRVQGNELNGLIRQIETDDFKEN